MKKIMKVAKWIAVAVVLVVLFVFCWPHGLHG